MKSCSPLPSPFTCLKKKNVFRIDKVQKSVNGNGILLCMCNKFGIYTYKLLIKSNNILINSMYWGKKVFFMNFLLF